MATERLSMRHTREILRQKWSLGRTHRAVAQRLGISSGAVGTTVLRARAAGLRWAQVEGLDDEALQARVYGPPTPPTRHRPVPDCAALHAERRKPGVTLITRLESLRCSLRSALGPSTEHARERGEPVVKLTADAHSRRVPKGPRAHLRDAGQKRRDLPTPGSPTTATT